MSSLAFVLPFSWGQVAIMFLLLHLQNADANARLCKDWQDTMIEDSVSVINLVDYFYCWGEN